MPVALLAAIVVAGIVTVLTARTVAGERATRFDRSFTESFHTADAGVQQAVFRLNAGLYEDATLLTETVDGHPCTPPEQTAFAGNTYEWQLCQTDSRAWEATSTGVNNDVARTVRANITEQPLFFPGAFGDTLIAVNGTSTSVDSYNSGDACGTECWGPDNAFGNAYGTGNGSIATNGVFDFTGNPVLRPGSAFLYDWLDNLANEVTASDPFGDRCDGNPCTTTYVSTIDEELNYASDGAMQFIVSALTRADTAGDDDVCDGVAGGVDQELGDAVFSATGNGVSAVLPTIAPYEADPDWDVTDPTDPSFENYYCADSLTFEDSTQLDALATGDTPVVIFVRDYIVIKNDVIVGCETTDGDPCSQSQTSVSDLRDSDTRPVASRLQIYVEADERDGGKKGSNITYSANSVFAGVVYAPRSRCGSPGGATVDIFGAIICGSMDNVGNWKFHFDDALGKYGTNVFGVGYYTEEPSLNP